MLYEYNPLDSLPRFFIPFDYWRDHFKEMTTFRLYLYLKQSKLVKNIVGKDKFFIQNMIDNIAEDIYFKRILNKEDQ